MFNEDALLAASHRVSQHLITISSFTKSIQVQNLQLVENGASNPNCRLVENGAIFKNQILIWVTDTISSKKKSRSRVRDFLDSIKWC